MILVAGGTGLLGSRIVELLVEQGLQVRVLTRDVQRAAHLRSDLVEVVPGDVRRPESIVAAMDGAQTVISAIQGFAGPDNVSPETVDWLGNRNLIRAAREAGVPSFILISVHGASPRHPMSLMRMKARAEEELMSSPLDWTIIRPTAYMETWVELLGTPLLASGKTRVFGRGTNPNNFVSAHDVARFVELAVVESRLSRAALDVGGPEDLSMRQLVDCFARLTRREARMSSVPLPLMRVMARVTRPLRPALARQIQAGVVMDTRDMRFDAGPMQRAFPSIPLTSLTQMILRDYGSAVRDAARRQPA